MTLTGALRGFARLLRQAPRGDVARLVALLLAAGLTEGLGLMLIVPLLAALTGEGAGGGVVRQVTATLGSGAPVGVLLAIFVGLVGLRAAIEFARDRVVAGVQQRVIARMRARALAALLAAEWGWLTATRRAHHASQLLTEAGRAGLALHHGLGLLVTLTAIAAYALVAAVLSPAAAAMALAGGAVLLLPLARMRRHAVAAGAGLTQANRALHVTIDETLAALRLAKLHGREDAQLAMLADASADLHARQMALVDHGGRSRAAFQIGGAALLAAFVALGHGAGHLSLPTLMALTLVFARLAPMVAVAQRQFLHSLHDMAAVVEAEHALTLCHANAEPVGAQSPMPAGAIVLSDVHVVHAGGAAGLSGVSLTLPVGSVTTITGPSGAGKSTLADTLVGLLAPEAGTLGVGDRTIAADARRDWRRRVAYVPQEPVLFHDTVRANLLWAAPDAAEPALVDALTRAAAGFVLALPKGLDTVVGDAGCRLSGGERQRLALARALLGKPALLVLDETTSALDVATEARVFAALAGLKGALTMVIIGHRLPALYFADRHVRLEAGRIAAIAP